MTYSYTKQPGDIVHAGYVYDGATQQPRTHPDGTFVLEAHVVEGPQAPPALPPQTAPPAAATPVAPATPTPPMPTPPTGATPAAPTPTPPMPSMPPTPAAPEPSAPVPPAPAVASDTPAPTPPPSTEALPDIPDDTLNSDDVAAVIDSAEATMTDFITQSFRVLREQLGIGESASVAGGRVTTKPQATSGDESSESDDSSDDETAIDKYNYYLEFEFNVEGDDGTVAPMTKDEFKELILEGADESSLEAICDHLGIDYSGYKSNRARSMKSSIIRVLYKGGDVPVIPESE